MNELEERDDADLVRFEVEEEESCSLSSLSSVPIEEYGLGVTISVVQMRKDLEVCLEALKYFIQTRFDQTEATLKSHPKYASSLYLSFGVALVHFIQAMFTYEEGDVALGIAELEKCLCMARCLKRALSRPSFAMRLFSVLARSPLCSELPVDECTGELLSKADIEYLQKHAELVEAESGLLLAVLRIFGEPDSLGYMTLLREVWTVRRAYIFYRQNELKRGGPFKMMAEGADDNEYNMGTCLGNGMINVIFSIMPPSIFKVFSVIGYTGDGDLGIRQLETCTKSDSLRAPLSQIFMCIYYTVMCGTMACPKSNASMQDRHKAVQAIIDPILEKHPDSPIFLFFQGRAHFLQHDVQAAIQTYERAHKLAEERWPEFKLVVYWDLILGHMRELQWDKCMEYSIALVKETRWSKAFCMYLELIFRCAVNRVSPSEEGQAAIDQLVIELPKNEKRIVGRAFPMERFAVTRCHAVTAGEAELLMPEYELLTFWDSYAYMSQPVLLKAKADLDAFLLNQEELSISPKISGQIALASVRRYLCQLDDSHALLSAILADEEDLISDGELQVHLLPLAHVEMAATLLAMCKEKEARKHYNLASKWKQKHYLDRTIQVRCAKLAKSFKR